MSSPSSSPSSPSPPKGLGEQLYSDAAALGQLRALIGLVIGCIISFILVLVGISKVMSTNPHTMSTTATVTQLTGCQNLTPNNPSYRCTVALSYTVNGTAYNLPSFSSTSPVMMKVGQTLTVYYDPANPADVSDQSQSADQKMGWMFIGLAFAIVGIAYAIYWMSKRYTFFAAAEGAGMAASVFR